MLPARPASRWSLAEVMPNCLESLAGRRGRLGLPSVDRVVVLVVDGLGSAALAARAGHARVLASVRRGSAASTFPTTTAAALATLTTGQEPGRHGLVGYSVLDRERDRVVNQLSGWDEHMTSDWQRCTTVFERATEAGVPAFAVGLPRFADSGFTAAVLRGARYEGGRSIEDRFAVARRILDGHARALVYLYVAELDKAAHAAGWESERWVGELERVDAAVGAFAATLGAREGLLVTADHGIVDVPADAHVVAAPELLEGVRHVAGEPRCLQLELEPSADADAVAARWSEHEGRRAWVATRDEAIAARWYSSVDEAVLPRIGDVLVAARGRIAYYVDADDPGRRMIGQHGSLSSEESIVPLLRFGAFAR